MRMTPIRAACLVAALIVSASGMAFGAPKTTAVFGLYKKTQSAMPKVDGAVAEKLGCELLRAGSINAQEGDIGLAKPDAFVVLACSKPVLDATGSMLDQLIGNAARIALFEGKLAAAEPPGADKNLSNRQYIVKVSTFNKVDPDLRRRSLAEIDALVATRPDRYKPVAAIDVNQAVGARKPDEVVVLYYDDGKSGERFRAGNPDIMGKIKQFNTRYVDRFIYYVGIAHN